MHKIATENNLNHVDGDSVNFMMQALNVKKFFFLFFFFFNIIIKIF